MSESIKAVLSLILISCSIAAAIAWCSRPTETVWTIRIAGAAFAILALGTLLILHFRRDIEPDYLRKMFGTYFNRGGFTFNVSTTAIDGIAYLELHFQNQFEKSCIGKVTLQPPPGFFPARTRLPWFKFEVNCAPAAFGVARLAMSVPARFQGRQLKLEVGASVRYPEGKGRRLRFRDGIFIRTSSDLENHLDSALTIFGVMAGAVVLSRPASATVLLPYKVSHEVRGSSAAETLTLWQLGNPPLEFTPPKTGSFKPTT